MLDLLYLLFAFLGIESAENFTNPGAAPSPWSHGLLMALAWSALVGLAAWRGYRSRQAGLLFGLVVFSHWVLDFIFWDNTYLLLAGSPQAGLGLYKALGDGVIWVELGLFAAGLAVYWLGRRKAALRPA